MKTYHRNFVFESDDFEKLCKYIINDNTSRNEYFTWHIGRIVDWKYNLHNPEKYFPDNFNQMAHLWFNYFNELIGFVINEDFNESFTVFLNEKYSFLYFEILDWIKTNWGPRFDRLITCVTDKQTELVRALEESGYRKNDSTEMTRVFHTEDFRNYEIEDPSVKFRSMSENGDYKEHSRLRTNAWPKTIDEETLDMTRSYIRRSPIYNPKYDFVLVSEEGRYISGCEAFIDYENNTAEIERVCTHSDFYNRGYARMVLKSCLRRLAENNISTAYLSGGYDKTIYLYGKLGHCAEVKRSFYELPLNVIG